QAADPQVGAARLERPGSLQVLALEEDRPAEPVGQHPGVQQRCEGDNLPQHIPGGGHIGRADLRRRHCHASSLAPAASGPCSPARGGVPSRGPPYPAVQYRRAANNSAAAPTSPALWPSAAGTTATFRAKSSPTCLRSASSSGSNSSDPAWERPPPIGTTSTSPRGVAPAVAMPSAWPARRLAARA